MAKIRKYQLHSPESKPNTPDVLFEAGHYADVERWFYANVEVFPRYPKGKYKIKRVFEEIADRPGLKLRPQLSMFEEQILEKK